MRPQPRIRNTTGHGPSNKAQSRLSTPCRREQHRPGALCTGSLAGRDDYAASCIDRDRKAIEIRTIAIDSQPRNVVERAVTGLAKESGTAEHQRVHTRAVRREEGEEERIARPNLLNPALRRRSPVRGIEIGERDGTPTGQADKVEPSCRNPGHGARRIGARGIERDLTVIRP